MQHAANNMQNPSPEIGYRRSGTADGVPKLRARELVASSGCTVRMQSKFALATRKSRVEPNYTRLVLSPYSILLPDPSSH